MLKMPRVPVVVMEKSREEIAVLCAVENMHREDLNCFEQAMAIRLLIDQLGLTQQQAGEKLAMTQSAVANKLRLLRLSEEERRALLEAGMTERHARTLLRLDGRAMRQVALERMIKGKMTVAQSERLVEDLLAGRVRRRPAKPLVRDVRVFFNTVNHALDIMRRGGIPAESQRREEEEYIEYIVRIPRESCMRTTG
jgi:ParB family chromosome partitioning protein